MSKLPILSGKKVVKALNKIGYFVANQRGSHFRLHHQIRKSTTVPNHVIGRGLLKKILRDTQLSTDEFIKLLKK